MAESIAPADLRKFVQQFFLALLSMDTPEREVIVDRAHRLPKPRHLPDKVPRDVTYSLFSCKGRTDETY